MYFRLYMTDKSDNYIKCIPVFNTINHGEERIKRYTEKKPRTSLPGLLSVNHI